jgi:hypothetical protein
VARLLVFEILVDGQQDIELRGGSRKKLAILQASPTYLTDVANIVTGDIGTQLGKDSLSRMRIRNQRLVGEFERCDGLLARHRGKRL